MWLKVVVPLCALGYVGYRAALALAISRARRSGDTARLEHLRRHGFGLYRWVLGLTLVVIALLTLLIVLETR